MPKLIFIGGAHGRTGTTLLKRLLCTHPEVAPAVPGETRLIERLAAASPFLDASEPFWSPGLASEALVSLRAELRSGFGDTEAVTTALRRFCAAIGTAEIRIGHAPPQPFVEPVHPSVLDAALAGLARDLLSAAAAQRDATHICEKTPSNAQFALLIGRWLPAAKLVVMSRDPVDVALSHTQRAWGPADPREAAMYTREYFDRWASVSRACGSFLDIEHRDLVTAPEATINRVLDFVGLPPSTAVTAAVLDLVREPESRVHHHPDATLADLAAVLRAHTISRG